MTNERVNPPTLPRPSGFSHAIVATGSRLVFLAGQTALDATGTVVGDTVAAQFELALANLLAALRAAGGSAEYLASITIYAVDLDDYRAHGKEIGETWRQLVGPGVLPTAMAAWSASARLPGIPPRWWKYRGTQSSPEPARASPVTPAPVPPAPRPRGHPRSAS